MLEEMLSALAARGLTVNVKAVNNITRARYTATVANKSEWEAGQSTPVFEFTVGAWDFVTLSERVHEKLALVEPLVVNTELERAARKLRFEANTDRATAKGQPLKISEEAEPAIDIAPLKRATDEDIKKAEFMLDSGCFMPNEVRRLLGMPPLAWLDAQD